MSPVAQLRPELHRWAESARGWVSQYARGHMSPDFSRAAYHQLVLRASELCERGRATVPQVLTFAAAIRTSALERGWLRELDYPYFEPVALGELLEASRARAVEVSLLFERCESICCSLCNPIALADFETSGYSVRATGSTEQVWICDGCITVMATRRNAARPLEPEIVNAISALTFVPGGES